jgi:hypothetical protein
MSHVSLFLREEKYCYHEMTEPLPMYEQPLLPIFRATFNHEMGGLLFSVISITLRFQLASKKIY